MGSGASLTTMSFVSNWVKGEELIQRLTAGDLVEFSRADVFAHWGVFIQRTEGISYIAHLSGGDGDGLKHLSAQAVTDATKLSGSELWNKVTPTVSADAAGIAQVRVDNLLLVARGSRCRVNNSGDAKFPPFTAEEIVARAVSELGRQKYHLLFTNCEHFAYWCRYGSKSSAQASRVKSLAIGTAVAVASGSAAMGLTAGAACLAVCTLGNQLRNKISRRFEMDW